SPTDQPVTECRGRGEGGRAAGGEPSSAGGGSSLRRDGDNGQKELSAEVCRVSGSLGRRNESTRVDSRAVRPLIEEILDSGFAGLRRKKNHRAIGTGYPGQRLGSSVRAGTAARASNRKYRAVDRRRQDGHQGPLSTTTAPATAATTTATSSSVHREGDG